MLLCSFLSLAWTRSFSFSRRVRSTDDDAMTAAAIAAVTESCRSGSIKCE